MPELAADLVRRRVAVGVAAGELNELNLDTSLLADRAGSKLQSDAIKFVMKFYDQWTTTNTAELMPEVAIQYSDNVDYYGARKSVAEVLADKQQSLQRWPIQKYKVRFESMTTNCEEKMLTCMATGIVDWVVQNPGRSASSTGSSRFSFDLGRVSPERFVIYAGEYFCPHQTIWFAQLNVCAIADEIAEDDPAVRGHLRQQLTPGSTVSRSCRKGPCLKPLVAMASYRDADKAFSKE